MKTRKLGDIEVSEIGIGCMGFSHGYGKIPTEHYSLETIRMAHDAGCTFFDTAEVYGPNLAENGHNELIVGKALAQVRKDTVIATKLHLHPEELASGAKIYDKVKDHLIASMQRLGTDYVDLYYLHRINEYVSWEEVAEAMGRLIKDGMIRGWGMSAVDTDVIARAHEITPLSAVQNIYSMVERGSEESVIPFCIKNNIGFVPFSPIASGLLSGKITSSTQFEKEDDVRNIVPQLAKDNIVRNAPIVNLISRFAELKGATPAQISLAWMLKKYPNVVPIPGSKNKERTLENLGAANIVLTDDEYNELDTTLDTLEVFGSRGFAETEQHNSFRNKLERNKN